MDEASYAALDPMPCIPPILLTSEKILLLLQSLTAGFHLF